ncbi:MAG: alanine--glyoxylate aminotransferase family protein, partial [Bdellovibrionales bacterium]|nr:alanine--glyoxylate aminotransferase family protein [Bdellovibrionales bacterium]
MKERKRTYTLLTPGPVPLLQQTRKILSEPAFHHRSPEFKRLFKELQRKLKYIFKTKNDVLILNSSGTGAMEASLINTLSPGDQVICVCGGKFGERWRDIALSHDIKTHSLSMPWGQSLCLKEAKKSLKQYPKAKAFLVSACETSTGTEHPIAELSLLLKQYPNTLFMVDGITGLGAMKLNMDNMGIDVLIGGSQKSFMLPAGLAFIALSDKAWKFQKQSTCPRYYFNLAEEKEAQKTGQTAFSSNVALIKALGNNLDHFQKKGLKHFIHRSNSLAQVTRDFCNTLNLPLLSERPASSVTTIQMPKGVSGSQVQNQMEKENQVIVAGGQGVLKDKIIRIGHLGPITNQNLIRGLTALGQQ